MAQHKSDSDNHRPAYTVHDIPSRLRPREEMDRLGSDNVSDDVLIAILLRSGTRGINVVELSRNIIHEYGSLTALSQAPVEELSSIKGIGKVKAQVLVAAFQLAKNQAGEALSDNLAIRTPADIVRALSPDARVLETEVFWVLLLDAKNRLKTKPVEVSQGLLDASLVHPREVFRSAIRGGCGAVVLAHNHPSGDPTPSPEDLRITKQLVEAGRIVDIKVLDHVILGGRSNGDGATAYTSLREAGLCEFA